jgi:hypothetical protein
VPLCQKHHREIHKNAKVEPYTIEDMSCPDSLLMARRPDIWMRTIALAESTTGLSFPHKRELPDGTLYACGSGYGGGGYAPAPTPESDSLEELKRKRDKLQKEVQEREQLKRERLQREQLEGEISELEKKLQLKVFVPEGSVEWVLHEVGHWLASTAAERMMPDHGLQAQACDDREWQALAFESMVFRPWGDPRYLCSPTVRDDSVVFRTPGPIAAHHERHIDTQLSRSGLSIQPWRQLASEWVSWGKSMGHRAPWEAQQ